MLDFYPQIKFVHVATVLASGALFLARGTLVQAGISYAMAVPVRYLSYAIDTVLLTSALVLFAVLPSEVFANGWLTVKVILLFVYIGLGTFALKRGRTAKVRAVCFGAALLVYASMYSIARTHDPLGPLRVLFELI